MDGWMNGWPRVVLGCQVPALRDCVAWFLQQTSTAVIRGERRRGIVGSYSCRRAAMDRKGYDGYKDVSGKRHWRADLRIEREKKKEVNTLQRCFVSSKLFVGRVKYRTAKQAA